MCWAATSVGASAGANAVAAPGFNPAAGKPEPIADGAAGADSATTAAEAGSAWAVSPPEDADDGLQAPYASQATPSPSHTKPSAIERLAPHEATEGKGEEESGRRVAIRASLPTPPPKYDRVPFA